MAQSLAKVLVHITFSTKDRRPLIPPDVREQMSAYLCGILKDVGSPAIQVNCVADHAHILCRLSRTRSIAQVVEEVKKGSSAWAKTGPPGLRGFYWQPGYGAFSVSESNAAAVREYIRNQEEHHKKMSFKDELLALLRRHDVEYDEEHLWG